MKRRDIISEAQLKVWEARKLAYREDHQAAMRLYEDALRLYKHMDDRARQYDTLKLMGDSAYGMEIFAAARGYYDKARAVFKNKLSLERERKILQCLKNVSLKQRDFPRAYRELKQLLALFPERQNIDLLQELGEVADQLGNPAVSGSYFAQALFHATPHSRIIILKKWGQALSRRGQSDTACQWYRLAFLYLEREVEQISDNRFSFMTEEAIDRAWNELEALRQELKAMGCDEV
jgi:tetratricopeptide (TPR) repeat protein